MPEMCAVQQTFQRIFRKLAICRLPAVKISAHLHDIANPGFHPAVSPEQMSVPLPGNCTCFFWEKNCYFPRCIFTHYTIPAVGAWRQDNSAASFLLFQVLIEHCRPLQNPV
jgi:hypothetical protein